MVEFEALLRPQLESAYRLAYRLTGSAEDAEDLVQEVFIRVYRHIGRFDRSKKFSTWIYTISSNLAKNELRNRNRRPTLPLADEAGVNNEDGTVGVVLEDDRPLAALRPPGSSRIAPHRNA